MTEVLFIGGPYHGKVKDIREDIAMHGLRYVDTEMHYPLKAEWSNKAGDIQLLTTPVKSYYPRRVNLFGRVINVQISEDTNDIGADYWLRNLIMKALGFTNV